MHLIHCIVSARVCTISCGEGWNGQGREGDQKNCLVQLQTPTKGKCLLSVYEYTLSVFNKLTHWVFVTLDHAEFVHVLSTDY